MDNQEWTIKKGQSRRDNQEGAIKNGINNLKSINSQEFWKLLKKGKTREQPNIPIDKLFEFQEQCLFRK
jgi:hypothetical protein